MTSATLVTGPDLAENWDIQNQALEQNVVSSQDGITTQAAQQEHPNWKKSVQALMELFDDPGKVDEPAPTLRVIGAGVAWLRYLRSLFPSDPPTYIAPLATGGIFIERRVNWPDGKSSICELAFHNDGTNERTDFYDSKVLSITKIRLKPQ